MGSSFDALLTAAASDLVKVKEDVQQRSPPPLFTFKKQKLTAKQVTSQLCLCMKEGEKKLQISVGSSVQPAVFWEAEGRRCGPVRSLKGIRTCTELVPVFPEHLQRP